MFFSSKGQGGLVCFSPWHHKESDMTEQLNNSKMFFWNSLAFCMIQRMLAIVVLYLSERNCRLGSKDSGLSPVAP